MKISEIIAEADILVPNNVPTANKVVHLNSVVTDFFNVVNIPKIFKFTTVAGQSDYALPNSVRSKKIDKVQVESFRYYSVERDDIQPTQTGFIFDDDTSTLSLNPAPYDALPAFVRYHKIATATLSISSLEATPEIPQEYHWTLVPSLAAYLAKTQDDGLKAANYESEYKAAWNVAAQNYVQAVNGADAQ